MAQRISVAGDLWADLLKKKRSLKQPMERLRKLYTDYTDYLPGILFKILCHLIETLFQTCLRRLDCLVRRISELFDSHFCFVAA